MHTSLEGFSSLRERNQTTSFDDLRIGSRHAHAVQPTVLEECLSTAQIVEFVRARDSLRADLLKFITLLSVQEYQTQGVRLFLAQNKSCGYGLKGQELISVFSLPGARMGKHLVSHAVAQGAREVNCYDVDGRLPRLYAGFGFVETSREPWNEALAPKGWDYERWGQPDYVWMKKSCACLIGNRGL